MFDSTALLVWDKIAEAPTAAGATTPSFLHRPLFTRMDGLVLVVTVSSHTWYSLLAYLNVNDGVITSLLETLLDIALFVLSVRSQAPPPINGFARSARTRQSPGTAPLSQCTCVLCVFCGAENAKVFTVVCINQIYCQYSQDPASTSTSSAPQYLRARYAKSTEYGQGPHGTTCPKYS